MAFITHLVKKLAAFLYDMVISRFLTITAHVIMMNHMSKLGGSFLDVGSGTGAPLQAIVSQLKQSYDKIVGVDMNHAYTLQSQKRFADDKTVSIYEMNFYNIGDNLKRKFNMIFFSFSFMLMPDQVKAINVAKQSLAKDGKISFIMTINQSENLLLMKIKPLIYRLTSIDFGNVTYQKQFEEILKIGGL